MCGIIGYSGGRSATKVVIESLERLEYRGYDSAGLAVLEKATPDTITIVKSDGKVQELVTALNLRGMPTGHTAIGHTRWATHGKPSVENAHPHRDCTGTISVIHNGIIENFRDLRIELSAKGHTFVSDTDSEVLTHLIEDAYPEGTTLAQAVRQALLRVEGAYAIVVVSTREPNTLVGARLNAPLVIGKGENEVIISSDITALLPYTTTIVILGDEELVEVHGADYEVRSIVTNSPVTPETVEVAWDTEQVQRGGFPHFMLKEIFDQPEAVRNALRERVHPDGTISLQDMPERLSDPKQPISEVMIVACGSALYAGMMAKYALEKYIDIPVRIDVASEFRYYHGKIGPDTVVLAVSQSGETADTLAAVHEAHRCGATVIAITNVVGSALARAADGAIMMQAGPEIGVAATKTFVTQEVCGLLFGLWLARKRGALPLEDVKKWGRELLAVPDAIEQVLSVEPQIVVLAKELAHVQSALYIARGMDVLLALEGALKLKEVSYIHAEAYPAGELKHGPIALLSSDVPIIAIAAQKTTYTKMVSNIQEVVARDAPVIVVLPRGMESVPGVPESSIIRFPEVDPFLAPLVAVVPLQLLAYHLAVERGCNVDQPRNLAKSVTVE
ncbi:MAG: glutamine--fructose-6-phosphate transaminase (isomerizing) [Candidatus Dormibacteria bacterium]